MTAQQPKKRCCGWVCRGCIQASSVEQVSPTGGGNATSCSSLKDCGVQAVTLVWAGNDLTSKWTTPETLTDAVENVKAFGEWYGIPIRLIDVVGERYTGW